MVFLFRRKFSRLHTADDLLRIELKWKERWHNLPKGLKAPSRYILSMFPYPSGRLHMGHVRVYTLGDCLARYQKLLHGEGTVLHPMGWDAFGLPAENAARQRGLDPSSWTRSNIAAMRQQMDSLSLAFDWSHEVSTCDESYYRWTQWIFLRLYKRGLAYRKEAMVNWDPVDETVLADEQVDANGCSWRSGAAVEKRPLTQWFLRITSFADELLEGLEILKQWPKAVKDMQQHWIGKRQVFQWTISEGLIITVNSLDELASAEAVILPRCFNDLMNPLTGEPMRVLQGPVPRLVLKKTTEKGDYEATEKIQSLTEYRFRDWLISRQRKWGTPIPMAHCVSCGVVPVSEQDLPIRPSQLGESIDCPNHCGRLAKRDTDTMDTFVDSSWYYLRFLDPLNSSGPVAREKIQPVSLYIGGVEHAVLHLLYARFIYRFLCSELNAPFSEPFERLICQGLVEGETYKHNGRYLHPEERATLPEQEIEVTWEKMSKSKHNGVDPMSLVQTYGADTVRLCVLFKAPPEVPLRWSDRDIKGPHRWLLRLLSLANRICALTPDEQNPGSDESLRDELQKAELKYHGVMSMEEHKPNVAIAALMQLTNAIEKHHTAKNAREALEKLSVLLSPLAPHTSAELVEILSN